MVTRLAAHTLTAVVAREAEPSRWSRGRSYHRRRAVSDLGVEPGRVTATVQGSRDEPYHVTVPARPAPGDVEVTVAELAGDGLDAGTIVDEVLDRDLPLVPSSLSSTCTCPDWEEPCKHAVATLLAFADAVADDPVLLLRWRGVEPAGGAARTAPQGASLARALLDRIERTRTTSSGTTLRLVDTSGEPHEDRSDDRCTPGSDERPVPAGDGGAPADPDLERFFSGALAPTGAVLGSRPVLPDPLPAPFRPGTLVVDGVDAGAVLADALAVLRDRYAGAPG